MRIDRTESVSTTCVESGESAANDFGNICASGFAKNIEFGQNHVLHGNPPKRLKLKRLKLKRLKPQKLKLKLKGLQQKD